jgi:imidazole glycerol phosphate synthase subunit HisF
MIAAIFGVGSLVLAQDIDFEKQAAEYIKEFPYQETYNYAVKYTGGDPTKLNTWSFGEETELVKAGEDKIVRMDNDTYYKFAFAFLDDGPVTFESTHPSKHRFNSFQF